MSDALRAVWDNTYGLLVDDGQLALGAVVALGLTWAVAEYGGETLRDMSGWILVALVSILCVANTYRAAHNARRKVRIQSGR